MFSACHWIWASCLITNSRPNLDQKSIRILDAVPFYIIFVFFHATSTHCGYITSVSSFKSRFGLNLIKLATFASRSNHGSHKWPVQFWTNSFFMSLFNSGQVIGQCQVNSCIPKMIMIDSLGNQFRAFWPSVTVKFNFEIIKKSFTGFQEGHWGLLTLSFIEPD